MTLEQHPDPADAPRPPLHAVPPPATEDATDPLSVARRAQDGDEPAAPAPESPRRAGRRRAPRPRRSRQQQAGPTGATGGHDPVQVLRTALGAEETTRQPAARPAPQPAPQIDPVVHPEVDPDWLPDYVEWRSGSLPRTLLGGAFVVVVVAAVVALFWAVSISSGTALFAAACLGGAAGMLWWAMLEWSPTVVSVSRGLLEVARGDRAVRVDLRSARTRVDLDLDVRSPRWRTVVSHPGTGDVVLRRRHVKVRQFVEIVGHHRRAAGA